MKLYAFYSHAADTAMIDESVLPGEVMYGDTCDWWWYPETAPFAEERADQRFAQLRHTEGLAVARVDIEVPDEIWAWAPQRDNWDNDGVFEKWLDDIEWECAWMHPAVTVIRQNDLSEKYRASALIRQARLGILREGTKA